MKLGHLKSIRHSEPKMIALRFRKLKDSKIEGVNNEAKIRRTRRNLVTMQFNMINWLLETVSLTLVMFDEKTFFRILYLLVTSCGTPLVYYLGFEDNRKKAREYFQSRMKIFNKKEPHTQSPPSPAI